MELLVTSPSSKSVGSIAQMAVHQIPDLKVGRSSRSGANPFYAQEKIIMGQLGFGVIFGDFFLVECGAVVLKYLL